MLLRIHLLLLPLLQPHPPSFDPKENSASSHIQHFFSPVNSSSQFLVIPPQRGQTTPHNTCARTHARVQKTQQRCDRHARDDDDDLMQSRVSILWMKTMKDSHPVTNLVAPLHGWKKSGPPSHWLCFPYKSWDTQWVSRGYPEGNHQVI